MQKLISFIKKVISLALSFFTLFVLVLIVLPSIWPKIDELTKTTFTTSIQETISDFFWKLWAVKEDIDKSIDSAWANTKAKKQAELDEINSIK